MAIVSLIEVGLRIGPTPILERIDLVVEPGEVVGISGPNGSGKTTLLGVIATLYAPTSGTGTVLGARLGTDDIRKVRGSIGYSGHEAALYPELTVAENLAFHAGLAGAAPDRVGAILDQVGLGGVTDRRADRCSNGMQRRVDLARLLLMDAPLLLLDEASSGLDAESQVLVDELLRRVKISGGAALVVSHHDLDSKVDRMVRIEAGRMAS